MQFSIGLKSAVKNTHFLCVNCNYGIDFIDKLKKDGYDIKSDEIRLEGCYRSNYEYIIIDEELARKLLVFKNTNHIEVVCAENSLNDFITQEILPVYTSKTNFSYKKFLGFKYNKQKTETKHLSYIEVKNIFDSEKFLKWWGENDCPCVIGDVEDPFDEGAENGC